MPECIHCREVKSPAGFSKVEHVMPQAFGRFEQNLTLHNVVCDGCNKYYADDLELYLGRDTPDGLNRYRLGVRDASEYRSLGKRSDMTFRIDSGPLAGAMAIQHVVDDELLVQPLPQVGFEDPGTKVVKWYFRTALPSREDLRSLFESGHRVIQLCEISDPEAVMSELEARGVQHGGIAQTREPGRLPVAKVEIFARLQDKFGRVLTKVSLNYLAYVYGAEAALEPAFDRARQYARHGVVPEERIWSVDNIPIIVNAPKELGHVLTVGWFPQGGAVIGQLSFHNFARYQVQLSSGALDGSRFRRRGHYFDLSTRQISELQPLE